MPASDLEMELLFAMHSRVEISQNVLFSLSFLPLVPELKQTVKVVKVNTKIRFKSRQHFES
jgi:hypothetical protein